MTLVGNRDQRSDIFMKVWLSRDMNEKLNILIYDVWWDEPPKNRIPTGKMMKKTRGWNGVPNFQTNPPGSTLGKQSL